MEGDPFGCVKCLALEDRIERLEFQNLLLRDRVEYYEKSELLQLAIIEDLSQTPILKRGEGTVDFKDGKWRGRKWRFSDDGKKHRVEIYGSSELEVINKIKGMK